MGNQPRKALAQRKSVLRQFYGRGEHLLETHCAPPVEQYVPRIDDAGYSARQLRTLGGWPRASIQAQKAIQNATAFLREHPDVTQQILLRLQALAGPEQVVSARLLPELETTANGKPEAVEAEADAEVAAKS